MQHTLDHYRSALMARLAELDGRLHAIEAELDSEHSKDWEDAAIEKEGEEVLEQLGNAGQTEIRRIQAALQRIREGGFGYCAQCGDEVSQDRLSAVPDTPFCQGCAAKHRA